jgi:hypothetical protein
MRKTRPLTAQALALLALLLSAGACDLFVPTPIPATPTPEPSPTPEFMGFRNDVYGFSFALPESWNGYSISVDEWQHQTSLARIYLSWYSISHSGMP